MERRRRPQCGGRARRDRVPGRDPRVRGRHADPERGGVRPGGVRHHLRGDRLRPPRRRDGHPHQRGVRLLLPPQPLQGRPRAVRRAARPLRAGGRGRAVRAAQVRGDGPGARRGARGPGAARRSPRDGAEAAGGQGHGPRRRGPRHLVGRFLLHQPDPHRGAVHGVPGARARAARRGRRAARLPGGGGPHEDLRGLADRQGRLHQGVRHRARPHLHQAHPRPHQPRRGHHRGPARPRPRGRRRGARGLRDHPGQRAGDGGRRPVGPVIRPAGASASRPRPPAAAP
ncbi:hypothetical protein SGPA1_12562 [Streptomyces misionensis JCM 4497]